MVPPRRADVSDDRETAGHRVGGAKQTCATDAQHAEFRYRSSLAGVTVRVRVLGSVGAVDALGNSLTLGRGTSRHALAHLAAAAPGPARAETIIEAAWGFDSHQAHRPALRMTMTRLRRALAAGGAAETIVHDGDGYRLGNGIEIDARRFEAAVARSRTVSDEANIVALTGALDLWNGVPYHDVSGPVFESEARRLHNLRIEAVDRRQHALLRAGRGREGVRQVHDARLVNPLHDGLVGLLMQTHYSLGDQAEALRIFEVHRRQLAEEMGLAPTPELQHLHLSILRHDAIADLPRSDAPHPKSPDLGTVVTSGLVMPSVAASNNVTISVASRADFLTQRADTSARIGLWESASRDYLEAVTAAVGSGDDVFAAQLCLRLARITWDPDLGTTVDELIREAIDRTADATLSAQLRICLAGGTYRSGAESTQVADQQELFDDLRQVEVGASPTDQAWAAMAVRDALAGTITPSEAIVLTDKVRSLGLVDPLITAQNGRAHFSDLLRLDQRARAGGVLRRMVGDEAEPVAAVNGFGTSAATTCWNLALGRLRAVEQGLTHALEFRGRLSAATLDQVVLGQSYWLSRELNNAANTDAHLGGALVLADQDASTPLWRVAAALLATDLGRLDQAATLLEHCAEAFDLTNPLIGSHRVGILSFTAEVLAMISAGGHDVDGVVAAEIGNQLALDPSPGVLLGWPTVFVGSKRRFMGFAAFAADNAVAAREHMAAAIHADRHMPPLHARSLDGLALVTGDAEHGRRADAIRAALAELYETVEPRDIDQP